MKWIDLDQGSHVSRTMNLKFFLKGGEFLQPLVVSQ